MITVEQAQENTNTILEFCNVFSREKKTVEQFKKENIKSGKEAYKRQFGFDIFADDAI